MAAFSIIKTIIIIKKKKAKQNKFFRKILISISIVHICVLKSQELIKFHLLITVETCTNFNAAFN